MEYLSPLGQFNLPMIKYFRKYQYLHYYDLECDSKIVYCIRR